MNPTVLWVIIILVAAAVVAAALYYLRRRRSVKLRSHFGPEYERAVQQTGDRWRAEAKLEAREKRVAKLDIRPLSPEERARFADAWTSIQKRFVDSPAKSVAEADRLVRDLMVARGYPMAEFERRAEDISVHYPHVVANYRAARSVAERSARNETTTEDLRKAVVYYRELFEELLAPEGSVAAGAVPLKGAMR
jgi:hypothetical protein